MTATPTPGAHYKVVLEVVATAAGQEVGLEFFEQFPPSPRVVDAVQAVFPGVELHPALLTYPEVARQLRAVGIPLQVSWYGLGGVLTPWAFLLDAAALLKEANKSDYSLLVNAIVYSAQNDAYSQFNPAVYHYSASVITEMLRTSDPERLAMAAGLVTPGLVTERHAADTGKNSAAPTPPVDMTSNWFTP